MSIIALVVILLIAGFIIYMVSTAPIPIHPWIKNLIIGVIFLGLVIWLLNSFGLNTGIHLKL